MVTLYLAQAIPVRAHTGLQVLDRLLPLSEVMAEPLLRFLVLSPPGVGLPGVYPGGVLPGTGENKKDGLGT